jgi:uncharacterized Zn finger protein (UPF0148 family)
MAAPASPFSLPQTPGSTGAKLTRGHSCLACHQRKVKCDGKRPCSTCLRTGSDCRNMDHSRPARAKETRSSLNIDRLLARLQQYEDLLKAHGIQNPMNQQRTDDERSMLGSLSPISEGENEQMIIRNGNARFVENSLWKGLEDEVSPLMHFRPSSRYFLYYITVSNHCLILLILIRLFVWLGLKSLTSTNYPLYMLFGTC